MLSSEPHWGGYHESGEQFEVLPQVVAVICLFVGLGDGVWWLCSLAAFVWAAETFFIKLSSAAGFLVLFAAAVWLQPWTIWPILGGGVVAGAAYLLWLWRMGRDLPGMLGSLWGHEVSLGRRFDPPALIHRLREKTGRLADTIGRQPIIPLLAVYGLLASGPLPTLMWWYLVAVAVTYLAQGADIRYYLILFWPVAALLGANGVAALLAAPAVGYPVLAGLALAWLMHNVVRVYLADVKTLNRWSWAGMLGQRACDRNLELSRCSQELGRLCRGKSLFVYGPYNQACVLAEASYPTPIVSAASWMDDVDPQWQTHLNQRLIESAPDCVLDTDRCFAAAAVRTHLGLDYELTHVLGDYLRLYASRTADTEAARPDECISFAPQTRDELTAEEVRSLVLKLEPGQSHAGQPAAETDGDAVEDPDASAAQRILRQLQQAGYDRVGIYGAGQTAIDLLDTLRASPVEIVAVFDDDARRQGQTLSRWAIHPLSDAPTLEVQAIMVCSERFERPMLRRCRPLRDRGIAVIGLRRGGRIEPVRRTEPTAGPPAVECPCP